MYGICFAFLANCVKNASSRVRRNYKNEGSPRDVANKLMSLEMLKFFLEKWERGLDSQDIPGSHSVTSFAFCIRRLVVPCLLGNTSDALTDPRIFRRLIQVVGVLWCSPFYRKHMKLEIGILFNHFVLKILKLGPQILFRSNDREDTTYLFAQQLELIKEIKSWFGVDTERFLELNLNFDTEYWTEQVRGTKDILPGLKWKISEQLCSFLCNLAEECTEFLGDKIKESQLSSPVNKSDKDDAAKKQRYEGMSTMTLARESARRLRQGALDAISQIVKVLTMSASSSLGEAFSAVTEAWYYGQKYDPNKGTKPMETKDSRKDSALVVGYWQKMEIAKNLKNESIYSESKIALDSRVNVSERKKNINVAFSISREKGLIKAIEYLIACNVLTASPREIASFLRIHSDHLDPAALGRYLGEGGSDHSETDFWSQIRFNFIRAISFVGMTVEEGLRHLLTQGGFRLPGEAQQIDRLISTFARCYWEDNAGDREKCPIENQDSIYLLSFAIIILNTDLHKSNHSSTKNRKKNQLKKMTKEEFITNLQRANKGMHISKEYLSAIYDGIKENPIVLRTGADDNLNPGGIESSIDVDICIEEMTDNVKSLDSLLRGLAIHEYRYISLHDYCTEFDGSMEAATLKLARCFMTKSWHQFHGLINSTLKIAHLDPKAMDSCIDLLKFALCLTILLDMPMEQMAFLDQLGRFRLFNAWRHSNTDDDQLESSFNDQESYKKERWYKMMRRSSQIDPTSVITRNYDEKFQSLILLDTVVNDMALVAVSLDIEAAKRKRIRDVVRQLENAEYLLNVPTRTFLREGNIMKRSGRSKRETEYRFFLFSDVMIYAKKLKPSSSLSPTQPAPKYRIHEELPLILMKVVDWFPPDMKKEESLRAIQFYHPRKIFMVLCKDNEERKSWVSNIREAIDKELQRKVAIETARKAAANVPANGFSRTQHGAPVQMQNQCRKPHS